MAVSIQMRSVSGHSALDLGQRRLTFKDAPVRLGGRALDVLCVLAAAKGGVVSKDQLLDTVWCGRTVEENNIPFHVSALRKELDRRTEGESLVVTVPGRGYRLLGLEPPSRSEPRQIQPTEVHCAGHVNRRVAV